MKSVFVFLGLLFVSSTICQTSADAAVQLSASVNAVGQATISWLPATNSTQYTIYRKAKNATSWGPVYAALPGSATQFTDTISPGLNYEYRVSRTGINYSGHGYINCAVELSAIESRGRLLLVVDSTFEQSLSQELNRLTEDMEGDGWTVQTIYVDRNASVVHVKSKIMAAYNTDPVNTRAVLLFGHIPVPYSGNINPDGHGDHLGAWPADGYYGDVNGNWTDVSGPTTTVSPPRTQNIPGDGKFDQSVITGSVELQVGRIDMYNMPAFNSIGNELQLLRNYLDKNHAYRKKIYSPKKRALIDDNFGYFSGEAFASGGYRNFAALVGSSNIENNDYITTLDTADYQWSFGCGGGSYTSASGIGNTAAIAAASLHSTFTMLFGSYFGDWDVNNSFLRAPLASGRVLTNVWSGRPHFYFHHMAMGENIGYSFLISQNFSGSLYFGSIYPITGKWVHTALMGDPTLRQDVVSPVSNVVATRIGHHCHIKWTASPEQQVLGYNIYKQINGLGQYKRINFQPITDTSYIDSCMMVPGIYKYMVRALKLENVASGSYFNMSEGLSDTAQNVHDLAVAASFTTEVAANSATFTSTSLGTGTILWDFGNGQTSTEPVASVVYTANGTYEIRMVIYNSCASDTAYLQHTVQEVGLNELNDHDVMIVPNPASTCFRIQNAKPGLTKFILRDMTGRTMNSDVMAPDETIGVQNLPAGIYLLEVHADTGIRIKKLVIAR